MDEPRKRNLRWLLGVLVVAIAAGTIWAATALAGGSSADNAPAAKPTGKATPAAKAQAKAKANARAGHDCPNRDRGISSSLDV
jgi:hypothetical protein